MWVYIFYIIWLVVLAYVDYLTGYVYCRMCKVGLFPVLVCLVKLLTKYRWDITPALVCIIAMVCFVRLLGLTGCIGGGDADVFVITSVVNTLYLLEKGITGLFSLLLYNCIFIYLAMGLFIIRYFRKIDWKHMKMDRSYPLLPSVYMSTVIMGIVIQLLYI